jgi:hypothetical protein
MILAKAKHVVGSSVELPDQAEELLLNRLGGRVQGVVYVEAGRMEMLVMAVRHVLVIDASIAHRLDMGHRVRPPLGSEQGPFHHGSETMFSLLASIRRLACPMNVIRISSARARLPR